MKAALVLTGSGPILVLTSFERFQSPDFRQKLVARGITKFIIHEVPVELVKKRYGMRFSAVMGDLSQHDDFRVMDYDGHHIFRNFAFEELGPPIFSTSAQEEPQVREGAIESEWVGAKIDEYGNLVESSYLPMLGSRILPSVHIEADVAERPARFKIDSEGLIFGASIRNINGRKLVLHGRSSPALGRTSNVVPSCTWHSDNKGGWTCIQEASSLRRSE